MEQTLGSFPQGNFVIALVALVPTIAFLLSELLGNFPDGPSSIGQFFAQVCRRRGTPVRNYGPWALVFSFLLAVLLGGLTYQSLKGQVEFLGGERLKSENASQKKQLSTSPEQTRRLQEEVPALKKEGVRTAAEMLLEAPEEASPEVPVKPDRSVYYLELARCANSADAEAEAERLGSRLGSIQILYTPGQKKPYLLRGRFYPTAAAANAGIPRARKLGLNPKRALIKLSSR
ncbi:MAG: hypothetical protein HY820_18765 [Acidobacteria bacterium]|nr:hypothetical protein [Acidobacteriota bacterium]